MIQARRPAVAAFQRQFGVSKQRAWRALDQPHSTRRLAPPVPGAVELALRAFLRHFARRPRQDWRRAYVAAKDAGWAVNKKRVHRLWGAKSLKVPYSTKTRLLRCRGAGGGDVPDPAKRDLGAGLPVRPDGRQEDAQADECGRRLHP